MDQFKTHKEVVRKMRHDGLVSDAPIIGKGQCGYADLNLGGFYFLVADRDKIAERLVESDYKEAFLELVARTTDREDDSVYFYRSYHVGGKVIPLSAFPIP